MLNFNSMATAMATAAVPAAPVPTDTVLADLVLADLVLADLVLVDPVPNAALPSRVRPGAGIWLQCGGSAVLRDHAAQEQAGAAPSLMAAGRSMVARPQSSVLFGTGTQAAGQAEFARQQRTSKKYAHPTTRIATARGGALGSHPARDPV